MTYHTLRALLAVFVFLSATSLTAADRVTLKSVKAPPEIDPDEPLAKEFSLSRATRYLDQAALYWQKRHKCGTCHTNFAYLAARPAVASVSPPSAEVRAFFEGMVEERWKTKGPRWDAEVVCAASLLAFNDRQTTGRLHPTTRKALEKMLAKQRADGGWNWLKCGWPPFESDDHYGVTLAALGMAWAPDEFSKTPAARKALDGVRRYLKKNPAPSAHHRAMLLWVAQHVDGILSAEERAKVVGELLNLQQPDGGWVLVKLLEGYNHKRKDAEGQDLKKSDGYATGFAVYVLRQASVAVSHPQIQKGVKWLKTHQRESGRWFTRSPTRDSNHFISNAGSAFSVMALAACGEVRGRL